MFGTIRKHQSWLWIIIITFMIFGLVYYFTPGGTNGGGRDMSEGNFGSIDGVPITKTDFLNAQREAYLAYFLSYGTWPDTGAKTGFDAQRETYQRLFFLQKLKLYNIHVDSEAVAQTANNILQQAGRGRAVPLDTFVQEALMPRANAEDFERYIRHQLGLQQLITVVGVSGDLVTPQEAKALYVQENQEVATEVVFFSGTNYQTIVPAPTPAVLGEFYTNNMPSYRLPDRVRVSYVSFDASNYLAEADQQIAKLTNLNAIVEQVHQQRGTNFYSDSKSPEEAKQKIRAEMRHEIALGEARKKADEFANVLFDMNPVRAENLATLAQTNGLKVKVTSPFDAQTGPSEFDGGPKFAKEAFSMSADQPFGGPLVGEDSVYVIALAKKVPSEVPPLDSIHERVLADYKHFTAAANARRAGAAFAQTVTNGLAQGKTFDGIVADSQFKAIKLPPVSLSTRELPQLGDRVNLNQFKQIALETQPKKASQFVPTADGGFIVYVQERLPIDQAKMTAELPEFLKTVRQARRQEAVNAWLQREGSKSLRDTPLMQAKPSLTQGQGKS